MPEDRPRSEVTCPTGATPYQIAMDIVGPLPRSRAGNKYILVVCDYATRYPEAIPLRSIDAEHVAEELLKIFARVGVPEEIQTDKGSNFTSQLLAELYRFLHVHPIRTTPYHPQTDGLVERFNQTLKSMLRKAATEDGKGWDKLLPYLLFAYREVPQASTGFSPFELFYGRQVRGPLDSRNLVRDPVRVLSHMCAPYKRGCPRCLSWLKRTWPMPSSNRSGGTIVQLGRGGFSQKTMCWFYSE